MTTKTAKPKKATHHKKILCDLAKKIIDGRLRPGDQLESTRLLAQKYGTSINPVQRVFKDLVNNNILQSTPRQGYVVSQGAVDAARRIRPKWSAAMTPDLIKGISAILFHGQPLVTDSSSRWFQAPIFEAIQHELAQNQHLITNCYITPEKLELQFKYLNSLRAMLDALIVSASSFAQPTIELLSSLNVPLIWLNNFPEWAKNLRGYQHSIISDDINGVSKGIKYLAGLGHEKIGLISRESPAVMDRLRGYRKGLESANIEHNTAYEKNIYEKIDNNEITILRKTAAQKMAALLDSDNPPTAVFCASDIIAFGAIDCLRQRSLTVGLDVSILGYDDIESWGYTPFGEPLLTTIRKPRNEIGLAVGKLIIDGCRCENRTLKITPELVFRSSCGPVM